MSVTYLYDAARNRIETVCDGDVRLVDVVNHFHVLALDPAIRPRADVRLDLRTLTSAPEEDHYPMLEETITRAIARRPFGKCAVLAGCPHTRGVANVFGAFAGVHFDAVQTFAEVESANAWLDAARSERPAER